MKIVFNTNYKQSAGARVCVDDLSKKFIRDGHTVAFDDWKGYPNFDVALFMAPDSDVRTAKKMSPKIVCGIMDPKVGKKRFIEEIAAADFLAVSSVEQYDFFARFGKPMFIYYMFPETEWHEKEHADKERIIIGYHGNKQHLDSMKHVSRALDLLAADMPVEFHAIYNIRKLGAWRRNLPSRCDVTHIQWDEQTAADHINSFDIGVIPTNLPLPWYAQMHTRPLRSFFYNPEGYYRHNYIMRYKYSNNPGRIYPFAVSGVPIVADMSPSTAQFIRHGENGFLASSTEGWYLGLIQLAKSAQKRRVFSDSMQKLIRSEYLPDITFSKFVRFLEDIQPHV